MSDPRRDDRDRRNTVPISPKALGVAFGLWIALMLALALVVVPALFASCIPQS